MKWKAGALTLILLLSTDGWAGGTRKQLDVPPVVIDWQEDSEQIIDQYNQVLEGWAAQSCNPRVRNEFQDLYKNYRAAGFYIPTLDKSQIDIKTIESSLHLIHEKLSWIQKLKSDLKGSKNFPQFKNISAPLRVHIDSLLEFKKQFELESKKSKREQIRKQSRRTMKRLEQDFAKFTSKIPFMTSFKYPVDHFANRFEYERLKTAKKNQEANAVFFRRQVFEDGALDPDHTESDLYLRTTLDTIAQSLTKPNDFLPEDIRYDLEWVLGPIENQLERGRKVQISRMSEWEERTANELSFYGDLLKKKGSQASSLAADKSEATSRLRDFVYKKHAATYQYFARQPDLIQALFVMDQILLNEIGATTAENYRDRRDVGQIVINRRYHKKYANLDPDETLYSYLKTSTNLSEAEINRSKWLNVMFKEEQFSFTLYFIPAVQMVFCPDFYKTARASRRKNLALALDLLKKPNTAFKATRYFSRFSMVGKIDMGQMWDGYVPLPPSPGRPLSRNMPRLLAALEKNLYRYLYDFIGTDGDKYHVIEIGKTTYVVKGINKAKPQFFNYRNPHSFAYFEEKSDFN